MVSSLTAPSPTVYATGAVIALNGGVAGGLMGTTDSSTTVVNAYWNVQTSGMSVGIGQNDSNQTVTGLTTAQLQGGASSLGSAFAGGTGGLYPYLASFYPNGVQAISGVAYQDAGVHALSSGAGSVYTVSGLVNGGAPVTATTGANGYYYLLEPAGAIAATGSSIITYSSPASGALDAAVNGARVAQATGTIGGVDIWGGYLTLSSPAATYSGAWHSAADALNGSGSIAASSELDQAVGSDTAARSMISGLGGVNLLASGNFTFDAAVSLPGNFGVSTPSGTITVADPLTVAGSNSLVLESGGAIAVNAPITSPARAM